MIGIPYARQEYKAGVMTCTCPLCGEVIELKVKKDWESYTREEYAEHYEACSRKRARSIADRIFAKRRAKAS